MLLSERFQVEALVTDSETVYNDIFRAAGATVHFRAEARRLSLEVSQFARKVHCWDELYTCGRVVEPKDMEEMQRQRNLIVESYRFLIEQFRQRTNGLVGSGILSEIPGRDHSGSSGLQFTGLLAIGPPPPPPPPGFQQRQYIMGPGQQEALVQRHHRVYHHPPQPQGYFPSPSSRQVQAGSSVAIGSQMLLAHEASFHQRARTVPAQCPMEAAAPAPFGFYSYQPPPQLQQANNNHHGHGSNGGPSAALGRAPDTMQPVSSAVALAAVTSAALFRPYGCAMGQVQGSPVGDSHAHSNSGSDTPSFHTAVGQMSNQPGSYASNQSRGNPSNNPGTSGSTPQWGPEGTSLFSPQSYSSNASISEPRTVISFSDTGGSTASHHESVGGSDKNQETKMPPPPHSRVPLQQLHPSKGRPIITRGLGAPKNWKSSKYVRGVSGDSTNNPILTDDNDSGNSSSSRPDLGQIGTPTSSGGGEDRGFVETPGSNGGGDRGHAGTPSSNGGGGGGGGIVGIPPGTPNHLQQPHTFGGSPCGQGGQDDASSQDGSGYGSSHGSERQEKRTYLTQEMSGGLQLSDSPPEVAYPKRPRKK